MTQEHAVTTPDAPSGPRVSAPARKLRVGVFADSRLQPRWLVEAFALVAASPAARIVVIAEGGAHARPEPWLWRAYGVLDRRLFASGLDPSERLDLRGRVPCDRVLSFPRREAGPRAAALWRAAMRELDLDVAFALGAVDDSLLEGLARYGVWRYCFGAHGDCDEALAGVREATDAESVTVSGLKIRRGPEERLVYRSWARTYPYSVARNRQNLLRKSAQFAVRALHEVHTSGEDWIGQCTRVITPEPARIQDCLGLAGSVWGLSKLGARVARRGLEKLFCVEQWCIAYRFGNGAPWRNDLRGYVRLVPPKDRLWADPFPLQRNGRYFIFFEELVFAEGKAHIAMVEMTRHGGCSPPQRVLERDYHLSYPFLIELGGELYMVPETLENRSIELYRCVEFPARWRLEHVLAADAQYADATLHQAHGKWWMFVNVAIEGAEAHDELHLFFADRLHGEWRPHRANPVKSDVRSARPAGRLFSREGALYRPAQICAPLYGSGIAINRVLELSPHAYREREETRIVPTGTAGVLGIHTLNSAGELSVLDGFLRRSRF